MSARLAARCAVCQGKRIQGTGWFQLVENRWTDRLRIMRFREDLANEPDVYNVCGAGHLREMVVHWMTAGRLDHPFARLPFGPRSLFRHHPIGAAPAKPLPVIDSSEFVGELAVDRESLTRILRQDPMALSGLLEAVVNAAEGEERLVNSPISGGNEFKIEESILF